MKIEDRVIKFLEKYELDVDSFITLTSFNSLVKEALGNVTDLPYLLQSSKMPKPLKAIDSITFYDIFPIVCTKCDKESVTSPIEILESILANNTACPYCLEKRNQEAERKIEEQQAKLEEKMMQRQMGIKVETDIDEEEKGYFNVNRRGQYEFVKDDNESFVNNKRKTYYSNESGGSINESIIPGYIDEDGNFREGVKPASVKAKELNKEGMLRRRARYIPKRNSNNEIEHVLSGDSSEGQEFYGDRRSNNELNEALKMRRAKETEMRLKRAQYSKYKEGEANVVEFNDVSNSRDDLDRFHRAKVTSSTEEMKDILQKEAPKVEIAEQSDDENEILSSLKNGNGVEASKRTIPE